VIKKPIPNLLKNAVDHLTSIMSQISFLFILSQFSDLLQHIHRIYDKDMMEDDQDEVKGA